MKEPSQNHPKLSIIIYIQLKSEWPFPQAAAILSFFMLGCSDRHTLTPAPRESSHWKTETYSLLSVLCINSL